MTRKKREKESAAAVRRYIYVRRMHHTVKRKCDEAEIDETDSGAEIRKNIIRWLVGGSNAAVVDGR